MPRKSRRFPYLITSKSPLDRAKRTGNPETPNRLYLPHRTTRFLNWNSIFRSVAKRKRLQQPNWMQQLSDIIGNWGCSFTGRFAIRRLPGFLSFQIASQFCGQEITCLLCILLTIIFLRLVDARHEGSFVSDNSKTIVECSYSPAKIDIKVVIKEQKFQRT